MLRFLLIIAIELGIAAAFIAGALTSLTTGPSLVRQALLVHLLNYYGTDATSQQVLPLLLNFAHSSALVATEPLRAFWQNATLTFGTVSLSASLLVMVLRKIHDLSFFWLSQTERKAITEINKETYSFTVLAIIGLLLLQAGAMGGLLLQSMMSSPWAETATFYADAKGERLSILEFSLVLAASSGVVFGYASVHDWIRVCPTERGKLLIVGSIATATIIGFAFVLPEASRVLGNQTEEGLAAIVEKGSPRLSQLTGEFNRTLLEHKDSMRPLTERWIGPLNDLATGLATSKEPDNVIWESPRKGLQAVALLYLISLGVLPMVLERVEQRVEPNPFDSIVILGGMMPIFLLPSSSILGRLVGLAGFVLTFIVYLIFHDYIRRKVLSHRFWQSGWNLWVSLGAAALFPLVLLGPGLAVFFLIICGCGYAWYRFGLSHSFEIGLYVSLLVWGAMSIVFALMLSSGMSVFLE